MKVQVFDFLDANGHTKKILDANGHTKKNQKKII